MSGYINKINSAGCVYKGAYKLGSKVLLEFSSPQGISMAVDLGDVPVSDLRSSTVTYRKSTAKGVDRQTLLDVMRESNGMTPVLVLEGRVAFLTSGNSAPRLDENQFVAGEEYELLRSGQACRLKYRPVVTSVEFDANPAGCIKLCDRVASRLSARMMESVLDSGERINDAYNALTRSAVSYFERREDAISFIVRDTRAGRDGDPALVQKRERDFELLHSHVRECLAACEAIERFNTMLAGYDTEVGGMLIM